MAGNDPRILIPLIEGLNVSLNRSVLECRQAGDVAVTTQTHMHEHTDRLGVQIAQIDATVSEDTHTAAEALDDVERAQARADDTVIRSNNTLADCHTLVAHAWRVRNHWVAEVTRATNRVHSAEAWVARAESRLARAEAWVSAATAELARAQQERHAAAIEVSNCESRVATAHSDIAYAQRVLEECRTPVYRTDSEGRTHVEYRDCSGCEQALRAAQGRLHRAQQDLVSAQHALARARQRVAAAEQDLNAAQQERTAAWSELHSARAELQAARADLAHCQRCLSLAQSALKLAENAHATAERAAGTAQEAVDTATAARGPVTRMQDLNHTQVNLLEQLRLLLVQACESLQQGDAELRRAQLFGDGAVDAALSGSNRLSLRVDDLIEVDRIYGFS